MYRIRIGDSVIREEGWEPSFEREKSREREKKERGREGREGTRSRIGALRDDSFTPFSSSWQCSWSGSLSLAKNGTLGARQSLFRSRLLVSEANSRQWIFSVISLEELDAETSSWREGQGVDYGVWGLVNRTGSAIPGFYVPEELPGQRVWEVPHFVIPNSFRDLGVNLIHGRVHDLGRATKDGSCQRPAGLRTGCWNKFSMTNYRVFRISKRSHTLHGFLKVPLHVIPNLFRDPFFKRIYDDESVNLKS